MTISYIQAIILIIILGIPKRYIYSTKSVETDELAKVLLHTKILDRIKLVKYENINELNAMQDGLIVLLRNFISNYRTCPTHVFLNYYCEKPMKELKMKEMQFTVHLKKFELDKYRLVIVS